MFSSQLGLQASKSIAACPSLPPRHRGEKESRACCTAGDAHAPLPIGDPRGQSTLDGLQHPPQVARLRHATVHQLGLVAAPVAEGLRVGGRQVDYRPGLQHFDGLIAAGEGAVPAEDLEARARRDVEGRGGVGVREERGLGGACAQRGALALRREAAGASRQSSRGVSGVRGGTARPSPVVDAEGRVVAAHRGVWRGAEERRRHQQAQQPRSGAHHRHHRNPTPPLLL